MSMLVYVAAKIQSALAEKRNMSYPDFCSCWNIGTNQRVDKVLSQRLKLFLPEDEGEWVFF